MTIRRYTSKPRTPDTVQAAQFTGAVIDTDLVKVAQLADEGAELSVVTWPSGRYLVVRYHGEHGITWTQVDTGDWLVYSERYDNLTDDTTGGLARHYTAGE